MGKGEKWEKGKNGKRVEQKLTRQNMPASCNSQAVITGSEKTGGGGDTMFVHLLQCLLLNSAKIVRPEHFLFDHRLSVDRS